MEYAYKSDTLESFLANSGIKVGTEDSCSNYLVLVDSNGNRLEILAESFGNGGVPALVVEC